MKYYLHQRSLNVAIISKQGKVLFCKLAFHSLLYLKLHLFIIQSSILYNFKLLSSLVYLVDFRLTK